MTRRGGELAVYLAMLGRRRLSGSAAVRNDPYWDRQAAYIGSLAEPTERRSWTVSGKVLLSWARMIADEAVESLERTGALPEWHGPELKPVTGLAEAIRVYKDGLYREKLHQEGRQL